MSRHTTFKKNHGVLYRESKSSPFKVGKPSKTGKRLTTEEFVKSVDVSETGSLATRNEEGEVSETLLLRPSPGEGHYWESYNKQESGGNQDTYMIIHQQKCSDMWNAEFPTHISASRQGRRPPCDGKLAWDESSEKRGLVWAAVLKCSTCGYKSKKYKLYDEIDSGSRGRKWARPNAGIQVGLAHLGLASTGLREIMSSVNMVPPSTTGLQKSANKINSILVDTNKKDMKKRLSKLKELNKRKGLSPNTPINIEVDGTYNNRLNSGVGKTPMQPASQATYLVAENTTTRKDIVHVGTYSKICTCKRNQEGVLQHRQDCTANLSQDAVIGNEGQYLHNAVADINSQDVSIRYITMDGDSNANAAATNILQSTNPDVEVVTLRCTRHLTRTLEREIKKSKFSADMFPGKNKADRERAQARFADDVGDRCQAEYNAVFDKHRGDLTTMKNKCSYISESIIECYKGNCTLCKHHSFVCQPPKNKWKRSYLDSTIYKREFINPSEQDEILLRKCLGIRFDPKSVSKTFLNTNQNKCEAANRGLMKGIPKHITFARNYKGRAHACVHAMNNGPGTSLSEMCAAVGAPIAPNSYVTQALQRMDEVKEQRKKYQKSKKYKQRRVLIRKAKYMRYDHNKAQECYSTGLADKDMICQRTPTQENTAVEYNMRDRRQRLRTSTHILDHNYLVSAAPTNEHNYFKA